ncbi:helix-turn-helix domain-containing protein [Aquimarina sp. 2-A2]|uniref:helix-turn-helix domain-containing protein n=1 Tax=Aquimarina sp. 2-A2 TaxID=3382644 RepID=UPI00387EFAAC
MREFITSTVCYEHNVSMYEIKSSKRDEELVFSRQLIAYLLSLYGKIRKKDVCEVINRNRLTVDYSIKTIRNYLDTDPERKKRILKIEKIIQSKVNEEKIKDKKLGLMDRLIALEEEIINIKLELKSA